MDQALYTSSLILYIMSENKLVITKGLPGSGKSTFAKQWVNESPKDRVRVNRDDIRRMLGPYWVPIFVFNCNQGLIEF